MDTVKFVTETNLIEGITRPPTEAEIAEHDRFIMLPVVTIKDIERFVSVYQPGAKIRDSYGMDVRVGNYIPPAGGLGMRDNLERLLDDMDGMTPYQAHIEYEALHPFMDGNGRSGRALWAWHMMETKGEYPLDFLLHFYYQSLSEGRVI